MSFNDFCRCTIEEIEEIFKAWQEKRDSDLHGEWERMRLHAVMTMQPHCKKKLSPEKILPLPWEKKQKRGTAPVVDKETAKKRFEQMAKRG